MMKRIIMVILAIGFVIMCAYGCKERQEPTYIMEPVYGSIEEAEKFQDFKSLKDYGLSTSMKLEKVDGVEQTKMPAFADGEEYTYSISMVNKTFIDDVEHLDRQYNMYVNSDNSIQVTYIDGTNTIATYVNHNAEEKGAQDVTIEEAKQQALDLLEDLNAGHKNSEYIELDAKYLEDKQAYFFDLVREVDGYLTDDLIDITVAKSGVVEAIIMYNIKRYDELKGTFSKSDLDYTKNKLEDKIESLDLQDAKITKTRIRANVLGKLFIEMSVEYGPENHRIEIPILATVN